MLDATIGIIALTRCEIVMLDVTIGIIALTMCEIVMLDVTIEAIALTRPSLRYPVLPSGTRTRITQPTRVSGHGF